MSPILVLGGTGEARALCAALATKGWPVIASLAGVTAAPRAYPVPTRIGGFGGETGYRAWLAAHDPPLVIDALHPFAATMRTRAHEVAGETGQAPLLHLARRPWRAGPGDAWRHFATAQALAVALPPSANPLITFGTRGWGPIAARVARGHVRTITPIEGLPAHLSPILQDPPYTVAGERTLLSALGITHLVSKAAGGPATQAKLVAARQLGVPVLLLDPPAPPDLHPTVHSPDAALAFCDMVLGAPPDAA